MKSRDVATPGARKEGYARARVFEFRAWLEPRLRGKGGGIRSTELGGRSSTGEACYNLEPTACRAARRAMTLFSFSAVFLDCDTSWTDEVEPAHTGGSFPVFLRSSDLGPKLCVGTWMKGAHLLGSFVFFGRSRVLHRGDCVFLRGGQARLCPSEGRRCCDLEGDGPTLSKRFGLGLEGLANVWLHVPCIGCVGVFGFLLFCPLGPRTGGASAFFTASKTGGCQAPGKRSEGLFLVDNLCGDVSATRKGVLLRSHNSCLANHCLCSRTIRSRREP